MARRGMLGTVSAACVLGGLVLSGCGPPAPVTVKAGCPRVLPGTSNANEDFFDEFVWQARIYVEVGSASPPRRGLPAPLRLGQRVTTVTCGLNDPPMAGVGKRLEPLPWPDGTATGLPTGTPIYAVQTVAPSCLLAVEQARKVTPYVAVDLEGDGNPLC